MKKKNRRQTLTINYMYKDTVHTEIHRGFRFRWTPSSQDGYYDLAKESKPGVFVWRKLYSKVISIELRQPRGVGDRRRR